MASEMQSAGYAPSEELDHLLTRSSGSSAAGSDTQITFNDAGTPAGAAGALYDKTNKRLSIGAGAFANSAALTVAPAAGESPFNVYNGTGDPVFIINDGFYAAFGDTSFAIAGCSIEIDNTNIRGKVNAPGGTVELGDGVGGGNGSQLVIDDVNAKVTSNVDIEFTADSKGPILVDRTTATKYRLFVDNGALGIETV